MKTCEQCGADQVDARGICQNCGWRASGRSFTATSSNPSLGETRAADLPASALAAERAAPVGRTAGANQYQQNQQTPPQYESAAPVTPSAARPTTSFCGTCGARLEPGQVFCGQCGAPVSVAPYGTALSPVAGQRSGFYPGDDAAWSAQDGNALTEAVAPVAGYGGMRAAGSVPYGNRYGSGMQPPAAIPTSDGSRTTRLVLGVLCLCGSLFSAIAAIVVALSQQH